MKYLSAILLVACCACETVTIKDTTSKVNDLKIEDLLGYYRPLSSDTLYINTLPDDTLGWKFAGKHIDTGYIKFFPEEFHGDNPSFACYQFPLDDNTIGLITRSPSEYVSSSVNLFAYRKGAKAITYVAELSEIFGDAGDYMYKESVLLHAGNSWEVYQDHIEGSDNDSAYNMNSYYQMKWNQQKMDTVHKDSVPIASKFKI